MSDGTVESVTSHALFSSNDDGIADVDEAGKVTVGRRGLAVCGAAYDGVGIPACLASAQLAATKIRGDLAPVRMDP